jgi:hypothetical protein
VVLASGRGGKRSRVLGDQEGVTGEYDADVVVPSDEGAALIMVKPQLAFEVFVRTLDLPAALEGSNQLFTRSALRHGRKHELRRAGLVLGPLDKKPRWGAFAAIFLIPDNANACEPTRGSRGCA